MRKEQLAGRANPSAKHGVCTTSRNNTPQMVQLVNVMYYSEYLRAALGSACRSDEQGETCEQDSHSPNTLSHAHENTAFKSM